MQHDADLSSVTGTPDPARASFCVMPFDNIDPLQALRLLEARSSDQRFTYVTTPNVDHVVRLHRQGVDLLPLYEDAWLTVCDSRVLARLSALAGSRLPVVTGADLTSDLLARVITPQDSINVIGANAEVIQRLKARYQLGRVNHLVPPMHLDRRPFEIARCIKFIERNPARFTFIAVGSPQQEKIARGAWARGRAKGVGLCVGNALMFAAGVAPRAPRWMQGLGLEWLHRLGLEPKRLARRYLVDDMLIFSMFLRHLLSPSSSNERRMRSR